MKKELKLKIKIAEAATSRYIENNRFTIQSLAKQLDMEPSVIFDLFPNRSAILDYFYESRLLVFEDDVHHIPGYVDFSLSEKLSNLFYHLLDQFHQHREFVLLTFRQRSFNSNCKGEFMEVFMNSVEQIFTEDQNISTSASFFKRQFFYRGIYFHFHALILFWMNDKSQNYETSMALVDKWCSFIEEIFYTKMVDKGFDLGKFLFYQSPFNHFISKK
jgi:AcrR family transcriptional regulator